jgi:hypothetical protein
MSDVELSHAIESSGQVGDLLSNDLRAERIDPRYNDLTRDDKFSDAAARR